LNQEQEVRMVITTADRMSERINFIIFTSFLFKRLG
jgi:hypothetical protein